LKPRIQASFPLFFPALAGHDADHQDPIPDPFLAGSNYCLPLFTFFSGVDTLPQQWVLACFFIETGFLICSANLRPHSLIRSVASFPRHFCFLPFFSKFRSGTEQQTALSLRRD
jgi:hypothetical protein